MKTLTPDDIEEIKFLTTKINRWQFALEKLDFEIKLRFVNSEGPETIKLNDGPMTDAFHMWLTKLCEDQIARAKKELKEQFGFDYDPSAN